MSDGVKEICFIMQTPLTKRDYVRFGFDLFKARGFQVQVLELTRLINPKYDTYQTDESEYPHRIKIHSKRDFAQYFKQHPHSIVIDYVGAMANAVFVYRIFRKFNIAYISVCSGGIPFPPSAKGGFIPKVIKRLKALCGLSPISIKESWLELNKLFYFMPYGLSQLQPPRYLIASALKCQRKMPQPDAHTKIAWAHTLDYDIYLQQKKAVQQEAKYAVFLDEYMPCHPDFLLTGFDVVHLDPDEYYKGLNRFFDWFEKTYQMPVIIAAHPSSKYDEHPSFFPHRKILKGQTAQLVQGAQCVFMHCSTAVNFAVLYHKPIIFLTSKALAVTRYGKQIIYFSSLFNKSPLNVDDQGTYEPNCLLEINNLCYHKYSLDYIKIKESPEKLFWEIVMDCIQEESREG